MTSHTNIIHSNYTLKSYTDSQYIGRIGMPRLMKVASMYSTMEIGTLPGPTFNWAS